MDTPRRHDRDSRTGFGLHDKDALARILVNRPIPMSELIGVFVYNTRSSENENDVLCSPIPISSIDQTFLSDMRVIRVERLSEESQDMVTITKIGAFVVDKSTFLDGSTDAGELPRIDIRNLLDALMYELD